MIISSFNEQEVVIHKGEPLPFDRPRVVICQPTDMDRLSAEHWLEFHDHVPVFNSEYTRHALCIQPFDGDMAVGYLLLYLLPSPYEPIKIGMVDQYFLKKPYRHSGVGREMFQLAEKVARHQGASKLTASYNLRQRHAEFFKSMGFDETHVIVAKEL